MRRVLDDADSPAIDYFNIGTGRGNSTLEIVQTFEKATGVKLNWKFGPRREGDIEKIWGDCSKANKILGWSADTPLEDVLASAWKWQKTLSDR
jgi:UDP-glucose 4-epimerase